MIECKECGRKAKDEDWPYDDYADWYCPNCQSKDVWWSKD